MNPIRAIFFDCNGVIADDEPIHLKLFQKVLSEEGIRLTQKEYFQKYLAMDDKSCFKDVMVRHLRPHAAKDVSALVERKAAYYQKVITKELRIFPGVKNFVKMHSRRYPLAVVSGALLREIELILKSGGLRKYYEFLISSEDVSRGKPDPQCYKLALKKMSRMGIFQSKRLKPADCIAIEDSVHGVIAAQEAGMKCLAVTNSYTRKALAHADWVCDSLEGIDIDEYCHG